MYLELEKKRTSKIEITSSEGAGRKMTDAGEGIRVSAASASRSLEVRHNARPCCNCLMEERNQKKNMIII